MSNNKLKIKKVIKDLLREALSQNKVGYVVAAVDQSQMATRGEKKYPLQIFKLESYQNDHEALETAIEYATQKEANVYVLLPNGTTGEKVFPEEGEKEEIKESEDDMLNILKGLDYSTINGLAYHLKECGCDTTMGYKNGNHTLMVRRGLLSLAIDSLKNTCDNLGQTVGEKLDRKYFKGKK